MPLSNDLARMAAIVRTAGLTGFQWVGPNAGHLADSLEMMAAEARALEAVPLDEKAIVELARRVCIHGGHVTQDQARALAATVIHLAHTRAVSG